MSAHRARPQHVTWSVHWTDAARCEAAGAHITEVAAEVAGDAGKVGKVDA